MVLMFGPETNFLVAVESAEDSELIERALNQLGFLNVTRVNDGVTALNLIKRFNEYVLIAGWNTPGLSGLDVINEIRHLKNIKNLTCVLVGSPQNVENMNLARQLKVNSFIFGGVNPDSIKERLARIIEKDESSNPWPEELEEKAEELMKSEEYEQAIALYEQAAQIVQKRSGGLQAEIGIMLLREGRTGEAVCTLEKALADNPTLHRAQSAIGKAYLKTGKTREAVIASENAAALNPCSLEAKIQLGESYLIDAQYERAEEIFDNLHYSYPEDRYFLNRLAIALRKQKKYDQASEIYTKALTLDRYDEHLHFNLGRCYFEARRPEMAEKHLREALRINPQMDNAKILLKKMNCRVDEASQRTAD